MDPRPPSRPTPLAPSTIPVRPVAGDATSSTTSSSSSSPPDFLRHINAVFKRHRPLAGTLQSNVSRASRVLVPTSDPMPAGSRPSRVRNSGVEVSKETVTPPSVTATVCGDGSVTDRDGGLLPERLVDDVDGEMRGGGGENGSEINQGVKLGSVGVDVRSEAVAGSTFATTMSVDTGPMYQCTRGHTSCVTQMSSSAAGDAVSGHGHPRGEGGEDGMKEGDHREDEKEKGVSGNVVLTSDGVPQNGSSQPAKTEHKARKKKYDPDVFFKVNGKLYQKLGKIGSGGSSEVHKVISSDCTIYALKKIKLKGRDYPTAYGFCQEIEYLNRLKGKRNIIQLIDYEVTDKILLQGVQSGATTSTREGRIRDDQYIYMVLEYGEIDLAHMLSQKWMDMNGSDWRMDENWLRFYWQQMLEAVNTIHEERIVHSDLKPANFLLVRGSLKLIDFGIAKAIMSDTTNIQRDAQVGTLNYMSPEAFMWNEHDASGNTIKCGRSSDIWSLGCILYQMVYGKTPFAEYKNFWAKFKVITDKSHEIEYEPVSNPWLIDLMKRCLAWERNERWRIPQLLQHPFLVPPMPTEPLLDEDHPTKVLMVKAGAYWDDPEVARICYELHKTVANLDQRKKKLDLPL